MIARGELGLPIVIKADGLAAGKGVVVAADAARPTPRFAPRWRSASSAQAGARVVIEECLTGPEVSFFALCDGRTAIPLGSAQDHKRMFDDDRGPNTGGMGAFAPSPLMDDGAAGPSHARDRRAGRRRHARARVTSTAGSSTSA